jgi:hypothetical protein
VEVVLAVLTMVEFQPMLAVMRAVMMVVVVWAG